MGPAVATYVHHRTSGNRKNALTAVLFPANLIGLVVPALLGRGSGRASVESHVEGAMPFFESQVLRIKGI